MYRNVDICDTIVEDLVDLLNGLNALKLGLSSAKPDFSGMDEDEIAMRKVILSRTANGI